MRFASIDEKKSIVQGLFHSSENIQSFNTYFQVYDTLTTPQYAAVQIDPCVLDSHEDVRKLALCLRMNPESTRDEFKAKVFQSLASPSAYPADVNTSAEQERAVNIAVQLVLMINCSDKDRHFEGYEVDGFKPVSWEASQRFCDFVDKVFPRIVHDPEKLRMAMKDQAAIKGWKLKKRAHVKFLPTDNLAEHLLYDPRSNVVHVFRQTAFLKAHLRLSLNTPIDCSINETLKLGTLPPQLILETLHSLQSIIFSPVDKKSSKLLESLVQDSRTGFDPDALLYDEYPRPIPNDFEYHYWGDRLVKLHDVVSNPRPRHRVSQWIQRHSSERNILFVAILSLVLSALFGFLSVVLGAFQAWVAYKAYQSQIAAAPPS